MNQEREVRRGKKKAVMALVRGVEAILREWDPIGVAPGRFAPRDEYDSYAPRILAMLMENSSVETLTDHLESLRPGAIGPPEDRAGDRACAERLTAWWKEKKGQA